MKRPTWWRRTAAYAWYRRLWWRLRDQWTTWVATDPSDLETGTRACDLVTPVWRTPGGDRVSLHIDACTLSLAADRLIHETRPERATP